MQSVFLFILRWFARLLILRHRPYVIGVTGTVGKTTISSHIATYLRCEFGNEAVRISPYHYNGEYGLPLSIIGTKTGGKNPVLWLWIFCQALLGLVRPFPKYLVLEYGIDHPGEMDYLLSIVIPDIAIISPVAPNHLEQFGSLERYRNEKLLLAKRGLKSILHESLRAYVDVDAVFYGMGGMSDIDASHGEVNLRGMFAQVHMYDKNYPLTLPSFGQFQIENVLPLYGIAHILGLDPTKISTFSNHFTPEAGRSSVLEGVKNSFIIDGTYNGGFESLCRGVDSVLPFLASHEIVFFIGDMRELGESTESIHKEFAHYFCMKIHPGDRVHIVLVGPLMHQYVFPLLQKKEYQVHHFLSSRDAGKKLHEILSQTEHPAIVYAKGSQNTIFLEEGIKQILLDPADTSKLCRQSPDWLRKKEIFFRTI